MSCIDCIRAASARLLGLATWRSSGLRGAGVALALATFVAPAQAAALSPRRLVEVADLTAPVVSPDGRYVAFRLDQASVERNTYDCAWYVQRIDAVGPPLRVADGGTLLRNSAGEPLLPEVRWSPDGRWIYFIGLLQDRVDVWRAAADGSGAHAVTQDPADVRGFALDASGRFVTYRVGATREQVRRAEVDEYDQGIRIDASVPVGQGLFRSGAVGGRLATQRLGAWFDRVPLLADAPDRWKRIDTATGAVQDVAASERPPAPLGIDALPAQVPTPWKLEQDPGSARVAVLTRVGDGAGLLERPDVQLGVLADVHSGQAQPCAAAACMGKAITRMQWRPGSDEVLFTVTDPRQGLAQSIFRWNVATGQVREVLRGHGLLSGGRDRSSPCGLSAAALVCVAADAGRPPYLLKIDIASGAQQVLFEPNRALAQDLASAMPVQLLRWHDAKGRLFTGQFYPARRRGQDAAPLFVTYYVCPGFVRGGVGDEWPLASLAERGVAALCINAAPYRLDALERYDTGLAAIDSAVRLLATRGQADPSKVGMGGLSFGTEMTLWAMMHSDLLAAASVSSPGISRQYYLLGSLRGEPFASGLRNFWQAGAPDETPAQWQRLSPDMNLRRMRIPLLMQMPEQEYMHTLDFAIPLIRERRADLYVFPNEPHQKFQPRHKLAVYERNLDWFVFWLMGEQDPAPAKTAQYAHWRAMRDGIARAYR
ncbi:Atxe2 family lasso peptide isopeptidase [Xanthomonas campestris pv. phormiicola]|nr:Atxe2 family lasso peptide isopeptidase [Xanthomonas campestris pv. phormiicola]UYC15967.1 Atxe2 family lasso peptide isopeptidase [Xanthomonas campestris pv. phormiicola]